jgi:hypothetical protein
MSVMVTPKEPAPTAVSTRLPAGCVASQPFLDIVGRHGKSMSLLRIPGQRSGWEPNWEPFPADSHGRSWTQVD